MVAYETKCKDIGNETLPLNFDIIQSSLRPIGLAITKIIFQIWSKKCWQFLDCAQIELQKGKGNKTKRTMGTSA